MVLGVQVVLELQIHDPPSGLGNQVVQEVHLGQGDLEFLELRVGLESLGNLLGLVDLEVQCQEYLALPLHLGCLISHADLADQDPLEDLGHHFFLEDQEDQELLVL